MVMVGYGVHLVHLLCSLFMEVAGGGVGGGWRGSDHEEPRTTKLDRRASARPKT